MGICLLAISACSAQEADRAVLRLMQGKQVRVLHRAAVNPEFDLVVAAAGSWLSPGEGFHWTSQAELGLFLQPRANTNLVYRITLDRGPADVDCYVLVERVSAAGVVLSCIPDKGVIGPIRKFVYDIRAKALVKRIEYQPFMMHRVFASGARAVLVGTDSSRLLAVEFDASREEPFRILAGAGSERYTRRLKTTTYTIGSGAGQRRQITVQPAKRQAIAFGPDARFLVTPEINPAAASPAQSLVVERGRSSPRSFPLPQSSYDEFASARAGRVGDGYARNFTQIEEVIGPAQISGGTLWLAKSFYDGEGFTGVGGFGYFDPDTRRYVLFSPPQVKDWSASALLVEPDAVWLGLVRHDEWRSFGGGLLRFDRVAQTATVIRLRETIGEIARLGNHLVMATEFGIAVYDGARLRRFFVDETTTGQLRIAEAVPGKAQ